MWIFEYIFILGIFYVIFAFVWPIVSFIPVRIITSLFSEKVVVLILIIRTYLLSSLTFLLAENGNWLSQLVFFIVGAFILFMAHANDLYYKRKQAHFDYAGETESDFQEASILMLFAPILLALMYLVPTIADNSITARILNTISRISLSPIIGIILGILGILFLLNICWMTLMLIKVHRNKLWKRKDSILEERNRFDEEDYLHEDDYL